MNESILTQGTTGTWNWKKMRSITAGTLQAPREAATILKQLDFAARRQHPQQIQFETSNNIQSTTIITYRNPGVFSPFWNFPIFRPSKALVNTPRMQLTNALWGYCDQGLDIFQSRQGHILMYPLNQGDILFPKAFALLEVEYIPIHWHIYIYIGQ